MFRAEQIIPHLQGVRRVGERKWQACCPVHDDSNPSLSLEETPDRRLLWHCHAGCSQEAVRDALYRLAGVQAPHQRPPRPQSRNPQSPQGLTLERFALHFHFAPERLKEWGIQEDSCNGKPAVRFDLKDREGNLKAVRYRVALTEEEGDRFRYRKGDRPFLFGLERLQEWQAEGKRTLVLTEGESDTLALWHAGIASVAVLGANAWQAEWWTLLDGFERYIACQDPDPAGLAFVRSLITTAPESIQSRTQVLLSPKTTDPNAPKDPAELWRRCEGDRERFHQALREWKRMRAWDWLEANPEPKPVESSPNADLIEIVPISALEPDPADAIVPNFLYFGRITLLAGEAGVGKTTFALEIAETAGQGKPLWGNTLPEVRTLWIGIDHSPAQILEILESYFGEHERPYLTVARTPLGDPPPLTMETLSTYVRHIQKAQIGLVVVDTLADWLAIEDLNDDTEARHKIGLVRMLAQDTGCAVLPLHHTRKDTSASGTRSVAGATRYTAKVDVVAVMEPMANAPDRVDAVVLKVLKDRAGVKAEWRLQRKGRRFVPFELAEIPRSEWDAVRRFLQSCGQATYEEIHAHLMAQGFYLSRRALQARILRWKKRGRVNVELKGFPPVARVSLSNLHDLHDLHTPYRGVQIDTVSGDVQNVQNVQIGEALQESSLSEPAPPPEIQQLLTCYGVEDAFDLPPEDFRKILN